ncbi:MAG: hypothetical protein EPO67_00750 [Reyranella sp.]|nr:MAG: hypothetical protein EPO67_00750 [Reyranella sp.]
MTAEASPRLSRSGTRQKTATVLILLLSTMLGLALAEGLTRLFLPGFDPSGQFDFSHHMGDLVLGPPGTETRQAKNTGDFDVLVRINRHGLRDDNDIATAAAGDIVVVGDSFAWGWGVEASQRFSDLLQGLTDRRTFNLSTPTDIEGYAALLAYARSLGAGVGQVVLAVCLENDLRDYAATPAASPGGGFDLKDWLARHSAAYVLLTTIVHRTTWLRDAAVRLGLVVPNLEGIARHEDDPASIDASADRLQALAKQYRLLVVLIPSRALWVGGDRAVEDRLHRAFVAALRSRDIDVLDLRPFFEAGGAPLGYHFANDGHWSPRGHRLAADAISQHLAR